MTKAGIGVLVGVVIGAGVGIIGGTIASVFDRAQKHADVRKGWNGSPVLVVNRDLAAGDLLTMENVEVRSVAEPFVSVALLKAADASYVVNLTVEVPLKAGQPLEWAFLPIIKNEERAGRDACVAAIASKRGGAR